MASWRRSFPTLKILCCWLPLRSPSRRLGAAVFSAVACSVLLAGYIAAHAGEAPKDEKVLEGLDEIEEELEERVIVVDTVISDVVDEVDENARPESAVKARDVGLEHIDIHSDPSLRGIVSAEFSPDGRQLYTASFATDTVAVFDCEPETGRLTHRRSITDEVAIGGAICFRLSPSSRLGVTTGLFGKTVALFSRTNPDGDLQLLHVLGPELPGQPLAWPTDAAFSPDSQFVYVIDSRGAAVIGFRIKDNRTMEYVETFKGRDGCFADARGIAMHPDGRTVFIASSAAGTLAVLDRDIRSGRLAVRELVSDGRAEIRVLDGVQGVCCSTDGKSVYTCSGRNRGSHAVAAFRFGPDRKLTIEQAFVNGQVLKNYQGGNEITISRDGRNVYASGTLSGSVACFRRDPAAGRLTYLGTLQNETTGSRVRLGACGLACSPTGKFLYATLEDAGAISIFKRLTPP